MARTQQLQALGAVEICIIHSHLPNWNFYYITVTQVNQQNNVTT